MSQLQNIFLLILGLPKTIIFNLKYFPLKHALRFPVFISHRVWLDELSGVVKINDLRTGAVKIGFGKVGIFDQHRSRTIWQVSGTVEFKGRAHIGHGSKISVSGALIIGDNFCISAESSIIAKSIISIGDDVLISWDSLIMDSDFHDIYDCSENRINPPMPIIIGNKVWIGCRTVILKGVTIADGVVVAATSTVTRPILSPNSIVGGNPARIIREKIKWKP